MLYILYICIYIIYYSILYIVYYTITLRLLKSLYIYIYIYPMALRAQQLPALSPQFVAAGIYPQGLGGASRQARGHSSFGRALALARALAQVRARRPGAPANYEKNPQKPQKTIEILRKIAKSRRKSPQKRRFFTEKNRKTTFLWDLFL